MHASKDFLKKKKGFSDENRGIIFGVIQKKFGSYMVENEKTNTVFVIPDVSPTMVYGMILNELLPFNIYSDILDLHVAVLEYENGTLIRLYDK